MSALDDAVRFTFDGRDLTAAPGQTVGAALVTNGVTAWRGTRKEGRPRGLFCGIGVCFDCLVTVDGVSNQRACLVDLCDGMDVRGSLADDASDSADSLDSAGALDSAEETR
ncbi:putative molibdopterin-dependent oxidoreductase YjgC [Arthrobacter woluwensis]|uniref:(2Fe-2S)-binding protein n=1 Tax=Arthrobacter woluwensis TaxID=156980 RepID=UPI0027816AF9|nr:(2Fe-2S)-binding protein [Arthrobacter woluwensis]MDQ0707385.1 putative molibdopterin-dependent oxidoreductase YjgC [Arthrobacter woluwensis]